MLQIPPSLQPSSTETLVLPSGRLTFVSRATPLFLPWLGALPRDTHGGKTVLDFKGQPAFAELVILWSLREAGWSGVWVDSYRRVLRDGYWDSQPVPTLPGEPQSRLDRIYARAGRRGGAWDIFAWRGDAVLFAESKRSTRDRLRETQLRFLEAALSVGESLGAFLLVEWSISGKSAPTK